MTKSYILFLCCLIPTVVHIACSVPPNLNNSSNSEIAEIKKAGNPLLDRLDGSWFPLVNGREAWEKFTKDGRYRMATREDFKFSEKLLSKDTGFLKSTMEMPYIQTDTNDDGRAREYAIFVVDNTIKNDNKFGVVIFHEPKDQNEIPEAYWVLNGKDLSTAVFDYNRSGLSVVTYFRDEFSYLCGAKWLKDRHKYVCQ